MSRAANFEELDTETAQRWEKFPDLENRSWYAGIFMPAALTDPEGAIVATGTATYAVRLPA